MLFFFKKHYSRSFCVMPWLHLSTCADGRFALCCMAKPFLKGSFGESNVLKFWNGLQMRFIRIQMFLGFVPRQCESCFLCESSGGQSYRSVELKSWNSQLGADEIFRRYKRTSLFGAVRDLPVSLDVRAGNRCNLECIMCQPRESRRWMQSAPALIRALPEGSYLYNEWRQKSSLDLSSFKWIDTQRTKDNILVLLPHLHSIVFGGGEPFVEPSHIKLIENLSDTHDVSNLTVRYHTNGTCFPSQLIPIWERFRKVEFFVSIDGIGNIVNYIRYPIQWETLKETITKIDSLGEKFDLRLLYSVNALNVEHFCDFIKWVVDSGFKKQEGYSLDRFVIIGSVFWPTYLCASILPQHIKNRVAKKVQVLIETYSDLGTTSFSSVLALLGRDGSQDDLRNLLAFCCALDSARATDARACFGNLIGDIERYISLGEDESSMNIDC